MKSKRNLHQIVVEALECYSYQANVESESFKRVVADKVYEDFCKEFYPPEQLLMNIIKFTYPMLIKRL